MQPVGERCEHRERYSRDGSFLQIGSNRLLAGSFRTRDLRNGPKKSVDRAQTKEARLTAWAAEGYELGPPQSPEDTHRLGGNLPDLRLLKAAAWLLSEHQGLVLRRVCLPSR